MQDHTDILIPLGKGSRHNNLELRYCLRSIEKHLSGVGNIWIVGDCPEWVQGVVKVPCSDNPNNWMRAHNIYQKILKGCNTIHDMKFYQTNDDFTNNNVTVSAIVLSDNFLFMNDDHYLLTNYVAGKFPYYHRGVLEPHKFALNQPQYKQMSNTHTTLRKITDTVNDYDVHCPILYDKGCFQLMLPDDHQWPEFGYGIKSLYGNSVFNPIRYGVLSEDLKFSQPAMKESIYLVLEGRQWFSIGDRCLKGGGMKEVLQELYPNKSKYEL